MPESDANSVVKPSAFQPLAFDPLAFEQLAQQPDFNPLQMMSELMAGKTRFHSVFIAPFTPTFASARQQYLTDGTGPLTSIAAELARQGAPDAPSAARSMLGAAQGMCVVVIAMDHGVSMIPQLFFGNLEPAMRAQMVTACGDAFPDRAELESALAHLASRIPKELIAGPAWDGEFTSYWLELAAAVVEGLEEGHPGFSGGPDRLADLGWWVSQGIVHSHVGNTLSADDVDLLVRCQLLAGDAAAAGQGIDVLIRSGEIDEEVVIELVNSYADGAIRSRQVVAAAQWLATQMPAWNTALNGLYDLPLALLRIQAAAGVGPSDLLPTARMLMAKNRKAARNDLTKEPIWEVVIGPGEVLDTVAAAQVVDRSTSFIAKRLEARTMPWHRHHSSSERVSADQVRIPTQALSAWLAVMNEFTLLD